HHRGPGGRRARRRRGLGLHHPGTVFEEPCMTAPLATNAMNATPTTSLVLDAEALYGELLRGVRSLRTADTRLAGIASGGAWLAERLQQDLELDGPAGVLSSAMHRDDFAQRGLSASAQTTLPFDVNGADILLLDDV